MYHVGFVNNVELLNCKEVFLHFLFSKCLKDVICMHFSLLLTGCLLCIKLLDNCKQNHTFDIKPLRKL